MPKDKDFKRLVRARMGATGERFTQAAVAIDRRAVAADADDGRRRDLLELLAAPATQERGFASLKAMAPDELRPIAVAGARHADWRIRRACCRLLDDLAFTPESFAALQACLDDPEPRVRRAAVHSLSCAHCKPDGCDVDVRGVLARALRDPSRQVREMAVGPLTYGPDEPWRLELLSQVATSDPSPNLRREAAAGVARIESMRESDRERRTLQAPLVAKTERHPGKWVAVRDGRIIEVGGHPGAMQRRALRAGAGDVRLFWVAPGPVSSSPPRSG